MHLEHRHVEKMTHYEGAARVPLIIVSPTRTHQAPPSRMLRAMKRANAAPWNRQNLHVRMRRVIQWHRLASSVLPQTDGNTSRSGPRVWHVAGGAFATAC